MDDRVYYKAYDDRYRQVHSQALQWFSDQPSSIVAEVIAEFALAQDAKILELGCGEGRDARHLLSQGYDVLATDVSTEAVAFCQRTFPDHADRFQVLDCITEKLEERFDFIYAVAVVHMLVTNEDRNGFYGFIREHLRPEGIALIGTMGDGSFERQSDITTAFEMQERIHGETGKMLRIAATSCRMVNFETFEQELSQNGLAVINQGLTAVEPDFPYMMYAVVRQRGALN